MRTFVFAACLLALAAPAAAAARHHQPTHAKGATSHAQAQGAASVSPSLSEPTWWSGQSKAAVEPEFAADPLAPAKPHKASEAAITGSSKSAHHARQR
jgi:opacity protein-like surface antigen